MTPRVSVALADEIDDPYLVNVIELEDGTVIDERVCPLPPPDTRMPAVADDELRQAAGSLTEVPAYDWCYGCSATSAAMLFGYYDRNGYPNMYAGPANGGLCPLDNSTAWDSGVSPLSATRQGYDGLALRGHVDDYWYSMNSTTDPYFGNWTEHGYADCTADYMGTSQWENWSNYDGSTTFFYYPNNSPIYDYVGHETSGQRDGCHGMRLFAESRGYAVVQNYNQYRYGYGGVSAGFTWNQYKQEIDAGRPVLIQVSGHTMLGVGYDGTNTVYVHDTWDHSVHSMTWGGSYSGMQHIAVTVIELEPNLAAPLVTTGSADTIADTTATLWGSISTDGGETCEGRFLYGTESGVYAGDTVWSGSYETGDDFSAAITGLDKGTLYYFVAEARNNTGSDQGSEEQFVTRPDAPTGLSGLATGPYSIDLSWTRGEGAGNTQVQRKAGAFPTSRTDGVTVYLGAASSASDSGLDPNTTYYYRAWSEAADGDQWSSGYDETSATTDGEGPVAATAAASSVSADGATLNGSVTDDDGEPCQYRFEYDTDSGEPYGSATTWTGSASTGQPFGESVSSLTPGTLYHFRAQLTNSTGTGSGEELTFTTLPLAPESLVAQSNGPDSIRLTWTHGQGADGVSIVRKTGGYPVDRGDGTEVYLDSGTLFIDSGLVQSTTYYYRAWSYHEASSQWSADYASSSAVTETSGTPIASVSPPSFDVQLEPGETTDYSLTVENSGDGTLSFTIGESVPPASQEPSARFAAYSATDVESWTVSSSQVSELIVKFKDVLSETSSAAVHESLDATVERRSTPGRFEIVSVPDGYGADELARAYLQSGLVAYVEPNYARRAAWVPDDPLFGLQWHLDKVNAQNAWDYRQGASSDVTVAVLDTGIAYEDFGPYQIAPDLAGVGFVPGFDFVNGDSHPNDDDGHGTHVCGTIAGATDNGIGVAGLAHGASIMPVKVLDSNGVGTVAQLADGIYYAVDHGADIINLSVSGEGTSQTEADALAYAYSHGVTVVCAAGNDYLTGNDPQFPAAYDAYCIAVGATRYDDARAPYSNTGSYVDIVAPGGDLSVDQNSDGHPDGVLQQTFDSGLTSFDYQWWQGTSMACPHVAAAAALVLSENRNLEPDAVRAVLQDSAVDLGAPGVDDAFGHGILDVAAAMDAVSGVVWLDESPKQGTVDPSTSAEVTVSVDSSGLADGDYTCDIVVGTNDPANDPIEVPFTLRVRTIAIPSVTTGDASSVEETTASLHGTLDDDGWEECEYRFEYAEVSGGPYAATSWTGSLGDGEPFSEELSGLLPGTTYYVRACARNSVGTGYGEELSFTTKPEAPTSLTATPDAQFPYYRIGLTWSSGDGAARTIVRGKIGSYPTDTEDGYLVYEGSAEECSDSGLQELTDYYYRAWSVVDDCLGQPLLSDGNAQATATTGESPDTEVLVVELQAGWNMVSVPLSMPDMSPEWLFPDADAVYRWDPSTRTYAVPDVIEPEVGYWVASPTTDTLVFEGIPVSSWSSPVESGWNMVGSAHGGLVDFSEPEDSPDGSVESGAYHWNAQSKIYELGSDIEPGWGYWIMAATQSMLSMTAVS